jgi:putative transposase
MPRWASTRGLYWRVRILDIFSRYVAGWVLAERDSATLPERLIDATCEKQEIPPAHLTAHADRGTAMAAKSVLLLSADLGVTRTHSRPHVSDDNPYPEAQFKTLKYHPTSPERFGSGQDARAFCQGSFPWYNIAHRHDALGLLTPEAIHYGRLKTVLEQRRVVLEGAYAAHPELFVRKPPEPTAPPPAPWINRPAPRLTEAQH